MLSASNSACVVSLQSLSICHVGVGAPAFSLSSSSRRRVGKTLRAATWPAREGVSQPPHAFSIGFRHHAPTAQIGSLRRGGASATFRHGRRYRDCLSSMTLLRGHSVRLSDLAIFSALVGDRLILRLYARTEALAGIFCADVCCCAAEQGMASALESTSVAGDWPPRSRPRRSSGPPREYFDRPKL